MFFVASFEPSAKLLTSFATTAKPLPDSPALAASKDAFKDNKLVCSDFFDMAFVTRKTMPIVKCETLPPDTRFTRAGTPLVHAVKAWQAVGGKGAISEKGYV